MDRTSCYSRGGLNAAQRTTPGHVPALPNTLLQSDLGDRPQSLYRGAYPFRTLWYLRRNDAGNLFLALFFWFIKTSPVWALPLTMAGIVTIVAAPKQRSLLGDDDLRRPDRRDHCAEHPDALPLCPFPLCASLSRDCPRA